MDYGISCLWGEIYGVHGMGSSIIQHDPDKHHTVTPVLDLWIFHAWVGMVDPDPEKG